VSEPVQADLQEALDELRQYLSDRLAPLMAMGSITLLLGLSARVMADEMASWSGAQAQSRERGCPFRTTSSTPSARSTSWTSSI
jgi:hypothetical protein